MADTRRIRGHRGPFTYALRFLVIAYLFLLIAWPVSLVVTNTFANGFEALETVFADSDTVAALRLTAVAALIATVINTVFGVAISLLLVRGTFPGRRLLSSLVDLPLAISPIVVGLSLVLVYGGREGWLGPTLESAGIQVIYATPGIVMATAFVALPLVIREVVPVLEEIGTEQEQAARSLGANGWQSFWRVTLPGIKWAVVYGVVLTLARSLGEFGAVKIVSPGAELRGETATLLIQNHYNNYDESTAYAAAFVLVLASVLALVVVSLIRKPEDQA